MFETLGHYKILERIGAGGMGEVYRARDTHHGRTVAVQVIVADVANDPDQRARLAAREPDMQSMRSPRAKPLKPQAAPDCAPKLRKAAMSANGQSRMPTQFQSPAQ